MEGLERSAVKTYRYLRLGVVGAAFALGASLVIEIVTGETDGILGSISAYYYTPVTGIFVGVLVAAGFGLIAIKGREGAEDIMLNLAGMLAPVVALVPTPISEPVYGLDPPKRSVPAALVPTVENNVGALLLLGVLGVVLSALLTLPRRRGRERTTALLGVGVAATVVLAGGACFVFRRELIFDYGHYTAAITMFVLLALVAVVNALNAADRDAQEVRGLAPSQYRGVYAVIAVGMVATLVAAVVMFAGETWLDWTLPTNWLFVVETLLLLLFTGFWVAQTVENWTLGAPRVQESAAAAAPRARDGGDTMAAPAT